MSDYKEYASLIFVCIRRLEVTWLMFEIYGRASVVKWAFANVPSASVDALVAFAASGVRLSVVQAAFVCGSIATDVTFNTKPAGAGVAIAPLFSIGANGVVVLPPSMIGWFRTNVGDRLTVTTGTGSAVGVLVAYMEV